ncbi:hypothetical protein NO357_19230 [Marimonas arenosa]|uniref:Uncharacterized protein n=1 Tax=Marimonas arenosa TaxID=1795305 RepID=A0AAE3WGL8_9RHOB|nr:hypothetical protein [Marimonas arenosa]
MIATVIRFELLPFFGGFTDLKVNSGNGCGSFAATLPADMDSSPQKATAIPEILRRMAAICPASCFCCEIDRRKTESKPVWLAFLLRDMPHLPRRGSPLPPGLPFFKIFFH